jgi:hypothetical protein
MPYDTGLGFAASALKTGGILVIVICLRLRLENSSGLRLETISYLVLSVLGSCAIVGIMQAIYKTQR